MVDRLKFTDHPPWPAPETGGKWEMFPGDLDKTWGDFDGASPDHA